MDKLLVIGAGGHGKVVADAAAASKEFQDIAFLDDRYNENEISKKILDWQVLGSIDEIRSPTIKEEYRSAFVAIGDSRLRIKIINRLKELNYDLPVIKHPNSWISKYSQIGEGSIILSSSNLQTSSIVGMGSILNTGCIVEHDVVLDDGVHICPGAAIAGNSKIGKNSWIGIGSSVKEKIIIGSNVTVGAGSVVVRDIPDNVIAKGVPAKWED